MPQTLSFAQEQFILDIFSGVLLREIVGVEDVEGKFTVLLPLVFDQVGGLEFDVPVSDISHVQLVET